MRHRYERRIFRRTCWSFSVRVCSDMAQADDEEFANGVKEILTILQSVPGRTSENGIRRVASKFGFEIFEEETKYGDQMVKRLSLGGSIVLVDIDLDAATRNVCQVSVSLGSSIQPSNEAYSFMHPDNEHSVNQAILKSLTLRKLDTFAHIIGMFARLDRLSNGTCDCFRCLDELATALFTVAEAVSSNTGLKNSKDDQWRLLYGQPVLNPHGKVGLGIRYWMDIEDEDEQEQGRNERHRSRQWYAMFDVREIASSKQGGRDALRYTQDWLLDAFSNEWNDPEPSKDSRARLVLKLDPPVAVSERLAESLNAEGISESEADKKEKKKIEKTMALLNERRGTFVREIYKPDNVTSMLRTHFLNLLPYDMVMISEIPLGHPRDIPVILSALRAHLTVQTLWKSCRPYEGTQAPKDTWSTIRSIQEMDTEVSFADAIVEYGDIANATNTAVNTGAQVNDDGLDVSLNICEQEGELMVVVQLSGLTNKAVLAIAADTSPSPIFFKLRQLQGPNLDESTIHKLTHVLEKTRDLGIFCSLASKALQKIIS